MKRTLLNIAIAAVVAGTIASCDGKERLAEDVAGTWATEQLSLFNDAQGQASGGDVFVFERNGDNGRGGMVSIASTISLSRASNALTPPDQPFNISVAATASIDGKWTAVDDDEIHIDFDASSLGVTVDPDAIALVANPLAGTTQSQIDSLKPQMAQFYQTELLNAMRVHYSKYARLDDVKLKDNGRILKIEVADSDMFLQKR